MGELSNIHSKHRNPLRTMEKSDLSIAPYDAANEDDQAESVDSGCVPDLTPETSWLQISSALNYEYSFVSSLLLHTSQSKFKSSVSSASQNKSEVNRVSTSTNEENKIKLANKLKELKKDLGTKFSKKVAAKKAETNIVENTSNTPNDGIDVRQKKKLESELRKLKKGKIGILTGSQAKTRESKIKKHLAVMEKKREKEKKRIKKENAVGGVSSNIKKSNEGTQKIYNKNGKLVFSKFDFSETKKDQWKENNKPDLNYYMSKVIKEKEKIESLTSQGKVNEAATYLEKKLWNNAMKKAQGEKVRDDSHRLKKSADKKKQQKKKSATKWNDRVNTVKKFQEKRQEKKLQNVASRKQKQQQRSKGKKKKGKGSKRVPGF